MENEIKVKVKNYQIIKEAEATFIPGLNIIVGPSNNGKTSFIKESSVDTGALVASSFF